MLINYLLLLIKRKKTEKIMNVYTNSHGYGDSTVTIYLGEVESSKCKVDPG